MTILRSGSATWVDSTRPSTAFGSAPRMYVATTTQYGLLQFGLPSDLHKGATVTSAKLRLYQVGTWTPAANRNITVQRLASKWTLSKVNWNNQPGTTGTVATVSNGGLAGSDGSLFELDVTAHVQLLADGAPNYGWRVSFSGTTLRGLYGFAAASFKPVLDVTYAYVPAAPTSLHPSSGAVSLSKPTLTFASGDISALQVQIDPAANAATAWDSGVYTTTTQELDLTTTSYPGLANGFSTKWRARVTSGAGVVSAWSDWVTFSHTDKPTLTITQPLASTSDNSPPVAFTMPGMVAYQVIFADAANPRQVWHDSKKRSGGSPMTYTPPAATLPQDDRAYRITVRAWDNVTREATPGDATYVSSLVNTVLTYDATLNGADTLTATQSNLSPWVDLTFTRSAMPDGWAIFRDGKRLYTADSAADLRVGATNTYTWRDWGAVPNRVHTYRAAPVVNKVISKLGPTLTYTPTGAGIWLLDPDTGTQVVLWGDDAGDWAYGEEATTYLPIGAEVPVRVTTGMRGLEGSLSGLLINVPSAPAYTVDAMQANLYTFKSNPTGVLRLVVGDINIPVQLYEINVIPLPTSKGGDRQVSVQFGFMQVGELPYEVNL